MKLPRSILTTYMVWAILLALYGGWVILTSDYAEKVGEETARYFRFLFAGGGIAFLVIVGLLAWLTQVGKVWAKCVFVVLCGYCAIDAILGPYALSALSPMILEPSGWVKSVVIALGWTYLAGLACYTRPNNSLQPTGSAGG